MRWMNGFERRPDFLGYYIWMCFVVVFCINFIERYLCFFRERFDYLSFANDPIVGNA